LDLHVPNPDDITRHYDEGEVIYVGAHRTGYTLRIVEPDPTWAQRYTVLAADILAAVGDQGLDIQHVGSTAVPGLPAKPIIDIDLTVQDPTDEAAYVPCLEVLGFVHWLTEPSWHEHRLLKHLDEPRVHLHVFGPDCPEVIRHRMFRDWLIAHPEDLDRYAAAKRLAASQMVATGDDNGALGFGMRYNRIKEPVVHEIYERMFRAADLLA
jgi:GrpB-like predicted nucleotidyltransferase (UPF0157 family)